MPSHSLCQYTDDLDGGCTLPAGDTGLCYWHDPDVDKTGPEVKAKLERYASQGGMLRGIIIKKGQLAGIDLVNHGHQKGYDLSYADLYNCDLNHAHLFSIQLRQGSLMKSDLSGANLNRADLTGSNLLGVTWHNSRSYHITLGNKIRQEQQGLEAQNNGDLKGMQDYFEQAEEIYRALRKNFDAQGLTEENSRYVHKELVMRRYQLPMFGPRRIFSKLVDLFSGYGEHPVRLVFFAMFIIGLCSLGYFFQGILSDGEVIKYDHTLPWTTNFKIFLTSVYFSIVTFTTLGYGDISPTGIVRFIAAIEAFTGSFTIALFVVSFVKKINH